MRGHHAPTSRSDTALRRPSGIAVGARIGGTSFTTSLFPRHGTYLVPVEDAVRRAEGVELGDRVTVHLTIDMSRA